MRFGVFPALIGDLDGIDVLVRIGDQVDGLRSCHGSNLISGAARFARALVQLYAEAYPCTTTVDILESSGIGWACRHSGHWVRDEPTGAESNPMVELSDLVEDVLFFERARWITDPTPAPDSCAVCGGDRRNHSMSWSRRRDGSSGFHSYTEPDDSLRLARMRARREISQNG